MSIMQDYEKLREILGNDKYDALDKYIQKFGKTEQWEKGRKEMSVIKDFEEWDKKYTELHKKCKPIFIEDVTMNDEEWNKFEKWYEDYIKNNKTINGYEIHKEGTWCEVVKDSQHIFDGNVDEKMTFEQIYQEVNKEVVFSLNGKEILSYDFINEFAGERKSTIESLAEENKCDEKDIKVSIRKPELPNRTLKIKFIGVDNWDRPVYKDEQGTILKDTNLGQGTLALCTAANNDFFGEPESPINEDIKINIVKDFNKGNNKNKKGRER